MNDEYDTLIPDLIDSLLRQSGSIDIAEAEFKRMVNDDDSLKAAYRDWCRDNGYTERHGFFDYCDEVSSSQQDIWDTLSDNDDY